MLTVDELASFGADTQKGLERCLGNEVFYLKLVKMIPADPSFARLQRSIAAGDLSDAFEAAHALKGVLANLSLTPIYAPVAEITELLRSREQTDYEPLLAAIMAGRDRLEELCRE